MKKRIILRFLYSALILVSLVSFYPPSTDKAGKGTEEFNQRQEITSENSLKIEPVPIPYPYSAQVQQISKLKPVIVSASFAEQEEEKSEPQGEKRIMEVTAYTAGYESTGKTPDHPAYGITYSGEKAEKGVTVAAGKNIPIGTKIYIPYFADWDNEGIFVVQDRGGAIGPNDIDVFFGYDGTALKEALEFGRQKLEVYILGEDEQDGTGQHY